VKVPFTTRRVISQFSLTTKIAGVKNNVEIEDARFAKPAEQP